MVSHSVGRLPRLATRSSQQTCVPRGRLATRPATAHLSTRHVIRALVEGHSLRERTAPRMPHSAPARGHGPLATGRNTATRQAGRKGAQQGRPCAPHQAPSRLRHSCPVRRERIGRAVVCTRGRHTCVRASDGALARPRLAQRLLTQRSCFWVGHHFPQPQAAGDGTLLTFNHSSYAVTLRKDQPLGV